jgi:hypothetical protein
VAQLRTRQAVHSIHTNDGVQPFQPSPLPPPAGGATSRQARAPWNLNRISHASLPVTASYTWASDGSGVNVYILDTVCMPALLKCKWAWMQIAGHCAAYWHHGSDTLIQW